MPHEIAGGSFATFEILRARRFGPSEISQFPPSTLAEFRDRARDIVISWLFAGKQAPYTTGHDD
jgi:hypothetical protein